MSLKLHLKIADLKEAVGKMQLPFTIDPRLLGLILFWNSLHFLSDAHISVLNYNPVSRWSHKANKAHVFISPWILHQD